MQASGRRLAAAHPALDRGSTGAGVARKRHPSAEKKLAGRGGETPAVAAAAGIPALIAFDGESNWLEGALLLGVYAILAVSFFYLEG